MKPKDAKRRIEEILRIMHPALKRALRRVANEGCAGSPEDRDNLMDRRLIEWVPGESGVRLTVDGHTAIAMLKIPNYDDLVHRAAAKRQRAVSRLNKALRGQS